MTVEGLTFEESKKDNQDKQFSSGMIENKEIHPSKQVKEEKDKPQQDRPILDNLPKLNINSNININREESNKTNDIMNFNTTCTEKFNNNINNTNIEVDRELNIIQPELNNYQPESQYISINAKAFSNHDFDDFQLNRISSDKNYKIFNSRNFEISSPNNFLQNFNSNMSPSHKQISPRLIDSPLNGIDSSPHHPMGINFFTSSEVNNNSSNNVQIDLERKEEVFRLFRDYRDFFRQDIEKLKSTGRSEITITEIKELKEFILLIVKNYQQYDKLFETMAKTIEKAGNDK